MARKLLSKADILAAQDIPVREIYIAEWDADVRVKGLNARERDDYESSITVGKGKNRDVQMRNMRAKLIVRCLVGDDNKPIFSEADVDALGEKSAAAIEKIFDVARELSGLSENDMEELAKNSESGQPGASHSA